MATFFWKCLVPDESSIVNFRKYMPELTPLVCRVQTVFHDEPGN